MKKLILFDLDGTLVDTLDDLRKAVNFALAKYSFPLKSREEIRKAIGNGTIKLIERSAPKGTNEEVLKELHKTFKNFYLSNIGEGTHPYNGITSLLIALKTKGYKIGVVSNKDHEPTTRIINNMFPGLFDFVQGSYMDQPKKPDPYLFDKVISESKFKKEEITYIGDTNVDEESAINSNLDYVLVSYGYRTQNELYKQVKTRNIINSVKEIDSIFK